MIGSHIGELQGNLCEFIVVALPIHIVYLIAIGINTWKITLQHIEKPEKKSVFKRYLADSLITFPYK